MTMNLDAINDEPWSQEDEDFALVADYLFGEMNADQRAAFEQRLEKDAAFRLLALPLVRALRAPRRRELMSAAEVQRHWKKFAHDNGIPLASPAEEAEEQLRQTVERLRRDATRPEDVANRPRADGTVPPPPFPRKTAQ